MITKKKNPWIAHILSVKKQNPNMKLSAIMKLAKKSYKK